MISSKSFSSRTINVRLCYGWCYYYYYYYSLLIVVALTYLPTRAQTATTDATKSLYDHRIPNDKEDDRLYKGWSGLRISGSSLPMVYYHDLTIAVVEIGGGRVLLNCELIEVFNDNQASDALRNLSKQLNRPFQLKFNEMFELMLQCDKLDPGRIRKLSAGGVGGSAFENTEDSNDVPTTPNTLMSGILPGTKWCGKGDLAKNYFDLGTEENIDMCCRKHDLCPTKVRGHLVRYNLTNKSAYTRSHCDCDDDFLKCLKSKKRNISDLMGNIYFNILELPCIEDDDKGRKHFREARHY